MGKAGKGTPRLVSRVPADPGTADTLILCPFLRGLDPATAMWLGPLAWHDCNAALLQALSRPRPAVTARVFAGVFCAEPFRAPDEILDAIRAAGIPGVVNLPSVSFLDGDVSDTLDALNLGIERELRFLQHAGSRGFRLACCLRDAALDAAVTRLEPELVICHAGPLSEPPLGALQPRGNTSVMSLSALLSDSAGRTRGGPSVEVAPPPGPGRGSTE